jgi:folate-dependent phosphoribosylglycinamide formyltransferase PurN
MAALLYASRAEDCPYEIVLVASNNPQAGGLTLAAAEGGDLRPAAQGHDARRSRCRDG